MPGDGAAEGVAGRARHLEVEQGGGCDRHRPQHRVAARYALLLDLRGPAVAGRQVPERLGGMDRSGRYATAGRCRNTLPAGVTLTTDGRAWARPKPPGGGQVAHQRCGPPHVHARLRTGGRAPRHGHRDQRHRHRLQGVPYAAATPGRHLTLGQRRPSPHRRARRRTHDRQPPTTSCSGGCTPATRATPPLTATQSTEWCAEPPGQAQKYGAGARGASSAIGWNASAPQCRHLSTRVLRPRPRSSRSSCKRWSPVGDQKHTLSA